MCAFYKKIIQVIEENLYGNGYINFLSLICKCLDRFTKVRGDVNQLTTSCRTRVNPSIRESRRFNGWFYAVGQEIVFAGHRQTLSSRCVIPSCTYSCYISRYNHVSKPHRVATSGRISRAKKEREPSGVSRLRGSQNCGTTFFSLLESVPDYHLRLRKPRVTVHYVGQFFFRPFARRSLPRASSSRETLKPDSK